MKKIAVVGLGYVGLPLALLAEEKGFDVTGVEVSKEKLDKLKNHESVIDDEIANKQIKNTKINFTDSFASLSSVDIAIICVPTPVDKDKNPDLKFVRQASVETARHLKPGSLLVLESTINPGVCDEVVIPLIEKETDHVIGKTLFLAHCPERINPGDPKWHVGNINRVLGADSPAGLDMAYEFYSQLVDAQIKRMSSLKEAEAVKVVENSFRDINIAFVNELAMSFDVLGINVKNVIAGAATKPFAFMPHWPSIGVGGHCIPVDPYYLIEYARGRGFDHKFLSIARSINDSMPVYAVDRLEQALIGQEKLTLDGAKVAVLGLSYKANVADDRESPAYRVIDALKKRGSHVTVYDPHMLEKSDTKTLSQALAGQDAAILATDHEEFLALKAEDLRHLSVFLDGKNALKQLEPELLKDHVAYLGIGS